MGHIIPVNRGEKMNIFAALSLLLSGLSLGMIIVNTTYSILFYIESKEKRKSSEYCTNDSGDSGDDTEDEV